MDIGNVAAMGCLRCLWRWVAVAWQLGRLTIAWKPGMLRNSDMRLGYVQIIHTAGAHPSAASADPSEAAAHPSSATPASPLDSNLGLVYRKFTFQFSEHPIGCSLCCRLSSHRAS